MLTNSVQTTRQTSREGNRHTKIHTQNTAKENICTSNKHANNKNYHLHEVSSPTKPFSLKHTVCDQNSVFDIFLKLNKVNFTFNPPYPDLQLAHAATSISMWTIFWYISNKLSYMSMHLWYTCTKFQTILSSQDKDHVKRKLDEISNFSTQALGICKRVQ